MQLGDLTSLIELSVAFAVAVNATKIFRSPLFMSLPRDFSKLQKRYDVLIDVLGDAEREFKKKLDPIVLTDLSWETICIEQESLESRRNQSGVDTRKKTLWVLLLYMLMMICFSVFASLEIESTIWSIIMAVLVLAPSILVVIVPIFKLRKEYRDKVDEWEMLLSQAENRNESMIAGLKAN